MSYIVCFLFFPATSRVRFYLKIKNRFFIIGEYLKWKKLIDEQDS